MLRAIETDVRIRDYRDRAKNTRIYCFPKDFNVVEDLVTRRDPDGNSRYNPSVLRPMIEDALKENNIPIGKLRWSRKAGCSCGCSPGFIMDGARPDIYITYDKVEE